MQRIEFWLKQTGLASACFSLLVGTPVVLSLVVNFLLSFPALHPNHPFPSSPSDRGLVTTFDLLVAVRSSRSFCSPTAPPNFPFPLSFHQSRQARLRDKHVLWLVKRVFHTEPIQCSSLNHCRTLAEGPSQVDRRNSSIFGDGSLHSFVSKPASTRALQGSFNFFSAETEAGPLADLIARTDISSCAI